MKTAEELIKIIKDNNLQQMFLEGDCFDWGDLDLEPDPKNEDEFNAYLENLGIKNFETVKEVCNSDEMYAIIHFKDENLYFEFIGTYDSYGNGEHQYHDDVKQVFPKEVLTTIYE